jgi:ABC-type phosphate/phosphonate transport system ATPase subunit
LDIVDESAMENINGSISKDKILMLRNISIGYNKPLVSKISKDIFGGEIIAILGPSGIGKTTLLRTIAGLIRPLSGEVSHKIPRRGGIGYIPQKLGLISHSSVRSNIALGAITRRSKWLSVFFPLDRKLRNDIENAMKSLHIQDLADLPVRILSGGQQRRVAIARTLIQKPQLILADEFFGELDSENVKSIVEATQKAVTELGATLLMVEHNEERALQMADRVWRIKGNELVEEGGFDE